MTPAYFEKSSWAPFTHQGTTYSLEHLSEYHFTVTDTDQQERRIAVTFSDHCFTRALGPTDDPSWAYPASTRPGGGAFCLERYSHSLGLIGHIETASTGRVWNADKDMFAILPVVKQDGTKVFYAILFSLDRVKKGLPIELHMRIKSSYPCTEKLINTFGEIRFLHLVALCMQGKSPGRILDQGRRKPKIP